MYAVEAFAALDECRVGGRAFLEMQADAGVGGRAGACAVADTASSEMTIRILLWTLPCEK